MLGEGGAWSRCLGALGLCLSAVEVGRGVSGGVAHPWLCEEILSDIVGLLNKDLPSIIYQEYQKWEGHDLHGEVLEVTKEGVNGGGVIFKVKYP